MKLVVVFIISTVISALAQDVIIKRNDSKIDAKIIEVQRNEIRYKKFTNPDGPYYTISKKDVAEIRYQNGEVESFLEERELGSTEFGRHLVSYNAFALLFSNVNLSYEHFFPSGKVSLKFPVTFGFSNNKMETSFQNDNDIAKIGKSKKFSVAVDFNFYPTGQGRGKYFLGTGIEYGRYDYLKNVYNFDPTFSPIRDYNKSTANYGAITFKNGFSFQPTDNFNIQLIGGLGMGKDYASYLYYDSINGINSNKRIYENHYFLYANGALNIGVRF